VEPAETYFYKLEDIDMGGRSTFHGPRAVNTYLQCGGVPAGAPGGWIILVCLLAPFVACKFLSPRK